ncbi:MAG: hypothetical protein F6J93_35180 [Oscillatoria sp. SIO1A7]|nr:hypothetical protein [Oscillatoria sp. SIO1A7]
MAKSSQQKVDYLKAIGGRCRGGAPGSAPVAAVIGWAVRSQCPMPNAPCPMPDAQFPIPYQVGST